MKLQKRVVGYFVRCKQDYAICPDPINPDAYIADQSRALRFDRREQAAAWIALRIKTFESDPKLYRITRIVRKPITPKPVSVKVFRR